MPRPLPCFPVARAAEQTARSASASVPSLGHHEHRKPSTSVPTEASGWRSIVRRSMARLVPQPGQKTSSQGLPASNAARIVGGHSMSRPRASWSFHRCNFGVGARSLIRGVALETRLHVEPPCPNPHDGPSLALVRLPCSVAPPHRRRPSLAPRPSCVPSHSRSMARPQCAGRDGLAIFDALHRRGTVTEAMLFAFDLLELDGVDYPVSACRRAQGTTGTLGRSQARRHCHGRPHRRPRRVGVRAGLPDGPGGHCLEATVETISVRPVRTLAQGQEP